VIHSDHRFAYEDVQEIIETKEGKYKEEILLLNEISQRMRQKRFEKGAINFSSQEVRFKLDEKGKPIGIMVKESKESHQLIEELMLLANRTVAENVSKLYINKNQSHSPTGFTINRILKDWLPLFYLPKNTGMLSISPVQKNLRKF